MHRSQTAPRQTGLTGRNQCFPSEDCVAKALHFALRNHGENTLCPTRANTCQIRFFACRRFDAPAQKADVKVVCNAALAPAGHHRAGVMPRHRLLTPTAPALLTNKGKSFRAYLVAAEKARAGAGNRKQGNFLIISTDSPYGRGSLPTNRNVFKAHDIFLRPGRFPTDTSSVPKGNTPRIAKRCCDRAGYTWTHLHPALNSVSSQVTSAVRAQQSSGSAPMMMHLQRHELAG